MFDEAAEEKGSLLPEKGSKDEANGSPVVPFLVALFDAFEEKAGVEAKGSEEEAAAKGSLLAGLAVKVADLGDDVDEKDRPADLAGKVAERDVVPLWGFAAKRSLLLLEEDEVKDEGEVEVPKGSDEAKGSLFEANRSVFPLALPPGGRTGTDSLLPLFKELELTDESGLELFDFLGAGLGTKESEKGSEALLAEKGSVSLDKLGTPLNPPIPAVLITLALKPDANVAEEEAL